MDSMKARRKYTAPLAIHCIWNISDASLVKPIVDRLSKLVSRDADRPFSHGVNIPFFVYESLKADVTPCDIRTVDAEKSICFAFSSEQTAGRKNWRLYYKKLLSKKSLLVIPIALNSKGLSAFEGVNAIRYEDGEESDRQDRCIIAILHEIYRYGFVENKREKIGQDSSLRVFLSHSKGDGGAGVDVAEKLRRVIDNTNMRYFFDATVISPGQRFEREIQNHLNTAKCAVVAIKTDGYSARYWCQREILLAKKYELPILAIDYLSDFEDRALPALANVPVMRLTDISVKSLFLILIRLLTETIRCAYTKKLFAAYKSVGWLHVNAQVLARPPEPAAHSKWNNRSRRRVYYPEPALYTEELEWFAELGRNAYTPLQCDAGREGNGFLNGKNIGISISDVGPVAYNKQCHPCMLKSFAQDLARHVLSRCGRLVYGGDLRHDGFTEYIISEASSLQHRVDVAKARVMNYLAWPIYVGNGEVLRLRAEYGEMLDIKELRPATDIMTSINPNAPLPPMNPDNCYIWSRCLTVMREQSIHDSFARVCAGGKLSGYKGKMPGVLEEIEIALAYDKMPLYLCGGFGGVVGEVCHTILTGQCSTGLTENWQILNNVGYNDVQEIARKHRREARYVDIIQKLQRKGLIKELSNRSGLSIAEYSGLMTSPFIDECIHLILKGLSKIVA